MKVYTPPLKYEKIRSELVSTIQSGSYKPGDKLPSESSLVDNFRASRSTVIRALKAVEDEGFIERRQGAGSFVTRKAIQPATSRAAMGLLKTRQTGRFPDSIVDQIQGRLTELLQSRGSALIVHTIDHGDDPIAVTRKLADQQIRGMFLVPMLRPGSEEANRQIAAASGESGPVVLLDGDILPVPHRSKFDVVGVENRHCGYLQTEHLLERGLRRIMFLGACNSISTVTERHLGYLDAMRAYNVDVSSEWTCEISSETVDALLVAELIKKHRPQGIVCKSDEFAALLMSHLLRMGLRVPEDLKIVGFDDRPIASLLPTTLTTIRQPIADIADAALYLMDTRTEQPDRAARRIQIGGELIVRQSSAR